MEFLRRKVSAVKSEAAKTLGVSGYAKVTTEENFATPAFSIGLDDDDGSMVSMEQLASMHDAILGSAKTAISETESSVSILREQREGNINRVAELLKPPSTPTRDTPRRRVFRRLCCCFRLFKCCR